MAIRIMPAVDAFAAAVGGQLFVHTGYSELFVGRFYQATDDPIDVENALTRRAADPLVNPLLAAVTELGAIAGDIGVAMPPLDHVLPTLECDWDPQRLYCLDNAYVENPVLCAFQRRPGPFVIPVSVLVAIMEGVAKSRRVLHLVLDDGSPLLPSAAELVSKDEKGNCLQPSLLQVMQAVSAAGVVVTNSWWLHDLAIGYRKPVAFLLPAGLPYRDPYAPELRRRLFESGIATASAAEENCPKVEVCRGGGCLVKREQVGQPGACVECRGVSRYECVNLDPAITINQIEDLHGYARHSHAQ